MNIPTTLKILMISALPFLIYLFVFDVVGFDSAFYQKKFLEYGVKQNVLEAGLLHEKVISFVKGVGSELPNEFNYREKQHLADVRDIIRASTIIFYILIVLFLFLSAISAFILKIKSRIMRFFGNVLVFGGGLSIILGIALYFLITSDFSAAFEGFHRLFFKQGTYAFDPATEILVRLYPEEIFLDMGIRISLGVLLTSAVVILLGAFLTWKSKSKKNK